MLTCRIYLAFHVNYGPAFGSTKCQIAITRPKVPASPGCEVDIQILSVCCEMINQAHGAQINIAISHAERSCPCVLSAGLRQPFVNWVF